MDPTGANSVYYRRPWPFVQRAVAAHNNLGIALSSQKKLRRGHRRFRKAIELDPKYANAYNNLGTP